jgi:signal transduction histidine kinase
MNGTNYSSAGSNGTTAGRPKVKIRLFGLVLTIFVTTIVVLVWLSKTTWTRVDSLQLEFTGVQVDNFYHAIRIRSRVQPLSDTLLRNRLAENDEDRDEYRKEFETQSESLLQSLEKFESNASTPLELEFAEAALSAYEEYKRETDKIKRRTPEPVPKPFKLKQYQFPEEYQQVQIKTEVLLTLCEEFINAQRSAFDRFLADSNATLDTFQRVLGLSVGLVVGLALMLLMLMYRGMIAPLRHELIESHATIARQEKLASLGSLAAGVAHEIRNPLTAIRFRLFSLKKHLPGSDSESEDVTVITTELDRLERIVQDFLRFARPSEPELVSLPAQRLLEEVASLLRPQLAKNQIELTLEESDPLWLRADTQQIKQVMINLIRNAAESIKSNGSIILRVKAERNGLRKKNGMASLEVSDSGNGIPPELEKRLFDPFFTTKEGGTGLGLPIAARIVEKHGGVIRYRTNSKGGATFSVMLPHVEEHETVHTPD